MIQGILCAVICAIAAYTDHKTGYIHEWLTNMGIFAGVVLLFLYNPSYAWFNIGIALFIFAIGFIFFIFGQLGGGDVKLFTVIALLLPYENQIIPPILLVFIYSGFLCIIGVFASLLPKMTKIKKFHLIDSLSSLMFLLLSFFMIYNFSQIFDIYRLAALSTIFLISTIMLFFRTELKNLYVGYLPAEKIQEEDILVVDLLPNEIVRKYKLNALVMKSDIEKIKKITEIKEFPVYLNLPRFGLYIFLSVILYLLFPNLIFG